MTIPVCLVTGFLGTGKTTLLGRMIEKYQDRPLIYLVNEFSETDIDGQRLQLPDDHLIALPGGSIFCRCLTADFIRTLRDIEKRFGASDSLSEGVVIETSGIANPKVIREMLEETQLDGVYSLRRIVTVVEPGSFLKLIHTLPNIQQQIEASDLIVLNKTDCYPPQEIERTVSEIRKIRLDAPIEPTQFCRVDFDPFSLEVDESLTGDYALCADPNYATQSVRIEKLLDWDRLKKAFASIQNDLYRVKGYVPTPAHTLYVDYSAAGWRDEIVEKSENCQTERPYELVLIVKGQASLTASAITARIKSGEFNSS